MVEASSKKERDESVTFAGVIFLILSVCLIPVFIGIIAQDLEVSYMMSKSYENAINYIIIFSLVLMLFFSTYAISQSNIFLNKILASFALIFLIVCGVQRNEIGELSVKNRYAEINDLVIKSYPNIKNTQLYKEFELDKENNNRDKLKYYFKNKNKYISIDTEKAMQLKLFYASTKNIEIRNKLGDIFKDGLVSKYEYEEFKNFIYSIQFSNDDQVFLSLISLK